MEKTEFVTVGRFTYAYVDLPDDRWSWAIVVGYRGAQDYDSVVCAFHENWKPFNIDDFLKALDAVDDETL